MTEQELLGLIEQAEREQWEELDLSGLELTELPPEIGRLWRLKALNLGPKLQVPKFNFLTTLPESLSQLTNLQSLNLNGNKVSTLPEGLGQLIDLQSLDLSGNNLTALPDLLVKLTNLQFLNLSSTKLTALPDWLGQLTNLQSLDLSSNDLTNLPDWLGQLTNLQSLDLRLNKLISLPESLSQLTKLQSLSLGTNGLTTLPERFDQLINLQFLNLRSNKFTVLPEVVANLPQLQQLYLNGNPFSEPLPQILGAEQADYGPAEIVFLRRYLEVGITPLYEAKLLIIGEPSAGKTSLAQKLQSPDVALNPQQESTLGINIFFWCFDLPKGHPQEQYRVNIWDFGGQMVNLSTHQFFLTKRSVYILVADTRRELMNFYTWLQMQETFGGNSPVILLKNRNRKYGNSFVIENLPQLRERFSNLKEVIEVDLSNIPQDESWPQLLRILQNHFLDLEHIRKGPLRTWVQVRQTLKHDERDIITWQQFLDLCSQHDIQSEENALQLSDYLHHLGDILHFKDDLDLGDIVILKPTWGIDAIYRVLENEAITRSKGQFSLTDLRSLWHEKRYQGYHSKLLRLMAKFQLCYSLPDLPDHFIAPQLITTDVPVYEWDNAHNLQLRYKYPTFMPRGILSQAIVKLYLLIKDQRLVWRSGAILDNGQARAKLLELRDKGEIHIRITGRNQYNLLIEVMLAFEKVHLNFPNLHYQKLVPCNCSSCDVRDEPQFYTMDELYKRLDHHKQTIECREPPYPQVSVLKLIQGGMSPAEIWPSDKQAIYNFYFGDGDHTTVGDIKDASIIAIGRQAQASST
jgi:internalin A